MDLVGGVLEAVRLASFRARPTPSDAPRPVQCPDIGLVCTRVSADLDRVLAAIDLGLHDMALGDIKRACHPGEEHGAKMAGFLLGFCFIDAAAGFHSGRTRAQRGVIGQHFMAFVRAYMPSYDPQALYSDLRSGLVHSYAIGPTYAFTDSERAGKHMAPTQTGLGERTLINLEHFVSDLEQAFEQLRSDIVSDPERLENARRRLDSIGLLSIR